MLQSTALAILKTGENVFLTGAPGAGKTYVLNQYIAFLQDHEVEVAITAYTGIAASHINGRTLHSWAGLTRGPMHEDAQEVDRVRANEYLTDRIRRARVLIIDEISMLHPEQFDRVDLICRTARNNPAPFGGLQLICCGDFFQIPPVNGESEKFVIDSAAWKNADMKICYLHEQHRQAVAGDANGAQSTSTSSGELLEILAAIRAGDVTPDIVVKLDARIGAAVNAPIGIARLYTHRENVDEINSAELRKLTGPEVIYDVYASGTAALQEKLKKDNDVPDKLLLKIGARVMFTKNNMGAGYVNGTLGEVIGFENGGDGDSATAGAAATEANPVIMTFDKKRITPGRFQWKIEEGGKVRASVSQLPLKLAWAITIHKSQGMTLDAAVIDLGRAFDRGMGYVALSRVRELKNISLIDFNAVALQVSPRVLTLDAGFKAASARAEADVTALGEDELRAAQSEFIRRAGEESGGKGSAAAGGRGAGTVFDDLRIDYTDIDEMPVADF